MNQKPSATPSRSEAWKNAAWYALVIATVLLVLIKFVSGVMFMAALILAVLIFMFVFAFLMRITPHNDD